MQDDYWIGDIVRLKGHEGTGTFVGDVSKSKAKVNVGGRIMLVNKNDLSLAPEDTDEQKAKLDNLLHDLKTPTKSSKAKPVPDDIDLHMEVLDPQHRIHQNRVLDYQVDHAKRYVEAALSAHKRVITIIHGKGTGLLKTAVLNYLKSLPQVGHLIDKHNGGATEVWFA
jgi:dsDNA-specific endonuclease/ATPase MutS2